MPDDSSRGSNKSSGNKSGGSANRTSSGGPSRSGGGSSNKSSGSSNNKSSSSSTNRGGPGNVGSSKSSTGGPSRSGGGNNNTRQSSGNNNAEQANRTSSGGPRRGRDMGKSTPVANRTSSGGPSRSSNNDRMNIKNIQFTSGTTPPAKAAKAPAKTATATPNSRKTNPPLSMGPQVAPPKFKGFSLKGLFSKDPANVARNRAASAMYASKASDPNKRSDSAEAGGRKQALKDTMREMDKIDPGRSKGAGAGTGTGADSAKTAAAAPTATRKYVAAPAGYRPGIDPEHKFFTMKNGGKVTPKGKK